MKRKKGYFSISAVAKMFSIHQQTIRLYEKEGLINPRRSDGNTRLFSDQDVDKLEEVIYLTHQLGINLAGVEMILKLRRQIERMQRDMNKVFDQTQRELTREVEASKHSAKANIKELMKAKQMTIPALLAAPAPEDKPVTSADERITKAVSDVTAADTWEIEYEE